MVEAVRARVEQQPDQLAFTFLEDGESEGPRLTYAQLDAGAQAIAVRLQEVAAPGERSLLFYPPGLEFIPAFLGCLYAGVIAVPVYPPRPNRDMLRVASVAVDCQPKAVLTTEAIAGKVESSCRKLASLEHSAWITTDGRSKSKTARWREPNVTLQSLAFLQYTSGSTGTPRGVMVSHSNLLHNSDAMRRAFRLTPDSVSVSWLPTFHDMGLIDGVLQPLLTGFPAYLMAPLAFLREPFRWLRALSRYRANHSGGPNFSYDLCVAKTSADQVASLDLSNWGSAFDAAEPVRCDTLKLFAQAMEVAGFRETSLFPGYGLAEATLMVTGTPLDQPPTTACVRADELEQHQFVPSTGANDRSTTLVSSGCPIADTQVRVVDPETCQALPPGQIGEIWVSGPGVAQGYWGKPEESRSTFQARIHPTGEGPFLRTGDLGCLQGQKLFVTGRTKDLIIIRGRNHYPQDIEATVEEAHPALRKGCGAAFGIDVLDQERLVIVQELDRQYADAPLREIIGDVRQAIVEVHDVDAHDIVLIRHASIPKTTSGKIQRHACRTAYREGTLKLPRGFRSSMRGPLGSERESRRLHSV